MKLILDPEPRTTAEIFRPAALAALRQDFAVAEWTGGGDRDAFYARHLPDAGIVIGQQAMGRDRLDMAPGLRAIFNVETNFYPNVDYAECFRRGVHVLAPGAVFALPVAEMALGMALSLARNIHGAHADFAAGREAWGLAGNAGAELLTGARVGIAGYGDLGRAVHRVLAGLAPVVQVFDPWLPDGHLRRLGVEPVPLERLMAENRVVFVTATVTAESTKLIDRAAIARMPPGAMLLILSRAAVADFDALAEAAAAGRIRVASDVWPEEPLAPSSPLRRVPNMLFSAHRAGALASALLEIGDRVLEDARLIRAGLPPVSCRRAERETVGRMQSKPVERT